jgi:hypothetical protein
MNRDEKLTRVPGLPPVEQNMGGRNVLSPAEPGGGTWIAANDLGVTLALINWYSVSARPDGEAVTRGAVVSAAGAAGTAESVNFALARLPLARIKPFRLVGVFPAASEIVEWLWDLNRLARQLHRWQPQQWISSGFDEPAAQRVRSRTFQRALRQKSAGTLDWLRHLHRSHTPQSGPFSTCMHRAGAATVSYAEVVVVSNQATMKYHPAAPCQRATAVIHHLRRRP